jgi:hypothetical protein
MSLDIYVMPLWQFKAGRAKTGAQRVMEGNALWTPWKFFFPCQRNHVRLAKQEVDSLIAGLKRMSPTALSWHDEGKVVFSTQYSRGFAALQAYARWVDLKDVLPEFDPPPEGGFYRHPALLWQEEAREFRFPHLLSHNLVSGYLLPCAFDEVFQVEPHEGWGHHVLTRSLGSSVALAKELEALQHQLPLPGMVLHDESLNQVREAHGLLKQTLDLSIRHGLPVIFWG